MLLNIKFKDYDFLQLLVAIVIVVTVCDLKAVIRPQLKKSSGANTSKSNNW